jgi:hypothetical protein
MEQAECMHCAIVHVAQISGHAYTNMQSCTCRRLEGAWGLFAINSFCTIKVSDTCVWTHFYNCLMFEIAANIECMLFNRLAGHGVLQLLA